jgi:hypothetical protein
MAISAGLRLSQIGVYHLAGTQVKHGHVRVRNGGLPAADAAASSGLEDVPVAVLANELEAAVAAVATQVAVAAAGTIVVVAAVADVVLVLTVAAVCADARKLKCLVGLEPIRNARQPARPAVGPIAAPEHDLGVNVAAKDDDLAAGAAFARHKADAKVDARLSA